MARLNCWEYTGCGHAKDNGANEGHSCPAAAETRLDGVHGGVNAGRACWVVLGTLCGGEVQTDLAKKYEMCGTCEFYRIVKREEETNLELTVNLLERVGR